MGALTIHFDGICTHIREFPHEFGVMPPHRVVLVHAEQGTVIAGQPIPPHVPTLEIDAADVIGTPARPPARRDGDTLIWHLDGAHLHIRNASPGRLEYDESYKEIPSLKEHNRDLRPPKLAVVAGTNAAAHFDAHAGLFSAETIHEGAWRAILEADTDGDPVLALTGIAGGAMETIQVRDGATITIANTGTGRVKESPYDFYLHYLAMENVPANPWAPPSIEVDILGPGCSNSNYP